MLSFNKKWFRQSLGCWVLEFVGKIEKKEDWNKPLVCEYEFPKNEGTIKRFVVEEVRERLKDHYKHYLEVLEENKIKVGFELLKEEDVSDWQIEHGGFNVRIWVFAYEHLPEEYAFAEKSNVYHKGNCYMVRKIKNPIIVVTIPEGKKPCKRCLR